MISPAQWNGSQWRLLHVKPRQWVAEVTEAWRATRPRRVASTITFLVITGTWLLTLSTWPWWVWWAIIAADAAVTLILGNRWANHDALKREQP